MQLSIKIKANSSSDTKRSQNLMTTKLKKIATSKSANSQQAVKRNPKNRYPYTHRIEFLGVGKDENADRYIRWRVGNHVAVVSVASMIRDASETYVRVQRA